ncbi:NAD(P)H-dependent oxidoreductase [Vibrio mexicanus]|uniref:NAD(P)H-dependent oxidoreductase n=1 Tax=Vibrio mexicanus TaxID=1004326 RepID=UPI00063C89FC|nr:NAD(P)H-dependent oxidoreductase [Vibrio mexicanus]
MSHVVVISGHPDLESSNTNTVILDELKQNISSLDVRRLDTLYPDYNIDIEAEQQALVKADVIILQFPFYWYSVPALMKKWIDDVFGYNFAYGSKGDKLQGKDFILSFTVGGPEESYDPLGYNHFSIEELMRPLQQTAYLAGMNYHKPVYTHRMVYISGVYNKLEEVQSRARQHASRLLSLVNDLTQEPSNIINKFVAQWFKAFDQLPKETEYFEKHIGSDFSMSMPEGKFSGAEGFRDWYAIATNVFKPNCDHDVEQIEVTSQGDQYTVELRVRLKAETYPDSDFEAQPINMLVNEVWQVSIDENSSVVIHDYQVMLVDHS